MSQQKIEIPGFGWIKVCQQKTPKGTSVPHRLSNSDTFYVAVCATFEGCKLVYPRKSTSDGRRNLKTKKKEVWSFSIGELIELHQGNETKAVVRIDEQGVIEVLDEKDWPRN